MMNKRKIVPCINMPEEDDKVKMGFGDTEVFMQANQIFAGNGKALKCDKSKIYLVYKHGKQRGKPFYGSNLKVSHRQYEKPYKKIRRKLRSKPLKLSNAWAYPALNWTEMDMI